jgi:hypothetical protein
MSGRLAQLHVCCAAEVDGQRDLKLDASSSVAISGMTEIRKPLRTWTSKHRSALPRLTAAVDRLVHYADIIELTGESYRKRAQAHRKKEKQNQKSY